MNNMGKMYNTIIYIRVVQKNTLIYIYMIFIIVYIIHTYIVGRVEKMKNLNFQMG